MTDLINDVSDTAIWVAHYRAQEGERPDALFRDPWAKRLAGARGQFIAQEIAHTERVGWSVVIRTCIIDKLILELLAEGVDTVVNIGAGLDSRPYRLALPSSLKWFEIDYPHLMDFKDDILRHDKPNCELTRIGLDLANHEHRAKVFEKIAAQSKRVLVLTEGVVPYLTTEHVAALSVDLRQILQCRYWIVDYFSRNIARFIQWGKIGRQMKNAPVRFFPSDWDGFFADLGWSRKTTRYLTEESKKLGRPFRLPWGLQFLASRKNYAAYVVLEPEVVRNSMTF